MAAAGDLSRALLSDSALPRHVDGGFYLYTFLTRTI